MLRTKTCWIPYLLLLVLVSSCGQKDERKAAEEKSKAEEAVKEAVTKEFKMYEGAKTALEKTEKEAQERTEKEKEVK
ncbi:MAG: hypothetical protein HYY45_18100 [Deltaproteobacteria bacterium]|nr:hypothetical protein [Deltaproteobacteria bacterium]